MYYNNSYNILSISGGGIRGIIPASLIEQFEAKTPNFVSKFDLLAGTSTGGLIALALASGIHPFDIKPIYVDNGKEIFSNSWVRRITSLGGFIKSKYDNKGLKKVLERYFDPKLKLGDLNKKVLIPCFKLSGEYDGTNQWHPVLFHNEDDSPFLDELVIDVAMRTSAAPTYFPSYQGYIDGGVAANDPSICAMFHGMGRGYRPSDILLITLGTGHFSSELKGGRLDWGKAQWALNITKLMITANRQLTDIQVKSISN